MTYNNDKRLEESSRDRFDSIYLIYCAGLKKIEVIRDKYRQYRGHDVHLIFDDGKVLVIDEKVRRRDWDDILIEYLSNKETGRKGWIYGNESKYLVYLFPQKGCYFLDTLMIKKWVLDKQSSFWGLRDVEAVNKRNLMFYTTVSKAVPLDYLEQNGFIYRRIPV